MHFKKKSWANLILTFKAAPVGILTILNRTQMFMAIVIGKVSKYVLLFSGPSLEV